MSEFQTENPEAKLNKYVPISVLAELGQAQYVARPLTNAFPDEYPNLGENIRYEGSYDKYHDITIHPDDILTYVNRYIDYKNQISPFQLDKESMLKKVLERVAKTDLGK